MVNFNSFGGLTSVLKLHIFLIFNCEELVHIRVICEGLVRFFIRCEELVLNFHKCEELVPVLHNFHIKASHGKLSIYCVDKRHMMLTLWAGPFLVMVIL